MADAEQPVQGPNITESFFDEISEYWRGIFKDYTEEDAWWRIEALVKHRCVYGTPNPCKGGTELKTAILCINKVSPYTPTRMIDIYCNECQRQIMRVETPGE